MCRIEGEERVWRKVLGLIYLVDMDYNGEDYSNMQQPGGVVPYSNPEGEGQPEAKPAIYQDPEGKSVENNVVLDVSV